MLCLGLVDIIDCGLTVNDGTELCLVLIVVVQFACLFVNGAVGGICINSCICYFMMLIMLVE